MASDGAVVPAYSPEGWLPLILGPVPYEARCGHCRDRRIDSWDSCWVWLDRHLRREHGIPGIAMRVRVHQGGESIS